MRIAGGLATTRSDELIDSIAIGESCKISPLCLSAYAVELVSFETGSGTESFARGLIGFGTKLFGP